MRCLSAVALLCLSMFLSAAETVTNGPAPKKKHDINFEVDLMFGSEEEEDVYLWTLTNTNLTVDKRGHMYVADRVENRILEFNPKGEYVRTVARKGDGPGELRDLFTFMILEDGRGVTYEQRGGLYGRMTYFDKDMNYLKTVDQPIRETGEGNVIIRTVTFSPKGDYFGANYAVFQPAKRKLYTRAGIFDMEFNLVKELSSGEMPIDIGPRMADKNAVVEFIAGHITVFHKPRGIFAFDRQGRVYTADAAKYEITRWSSDLKTPDMIFGREYKPIIMTEDHQEGLIRVLQDEAAVNFMLGDANNDAFVRRAIEKSEPPEAKYPVFAIVPLEQGGVVVVHDVNLGTLREKADFFDEQGQYLGQHAFEGQPLTATTSRIFPRMVFRNGFAYSVITDENLEPRAVRYTYSIEPR